MCLILEEPGGSQPQGTHEVNDVLRDETQAVGHKRRGRTCKILTIDGLHGFLLTTQRSRAPCEGPGLKIVVVGRGAMMLSTPRSHFLRGSACSVAWPAPACIQGLLGFDGLKVERLLFRLLARAVHSREEDSIDGLLGLGDADPVVLTGHREMPKLRMMCGLLSL